MRCASNIVFLNADCLICRKQFGDAEMRFETRRELAERPLISEICSQFPHPFSIQSSTEKWIENVQHLERNSQKENNFYKLAEALQIMWNEVDKVFKATITVFWPKCWQDHWQGVVSGGKLSYVTIVSMLSRLSSVLYGVHCSCSLHYITAYYRAKSWSKNEPPPLEGAFEVWQDRRKGFPRTQWLTIRRPTQSYDFESNRVITRCALIQALSFWFWWNYHHGHHDHDFLAPSQKYLAWLVSDGG